MGCHLGVWDSVPGLKAVVTVHFLVLSVTSCRSAAGRKPCGREDPLQPLSDGAEQRRRAVVDPGWREEPVPVLQLGPGPGGLPGPL